jgi:DNA polymerase elongation subunit (family B)
LKSYINVYQSSANKITHIYALNGKKQREVVEFQPILGYKVNEESDWKDIYGNNLKTIRFQNIAEAKDWIKENKNMFDIYGDINPHLAFITEHYKGEIPPQREVMNIYNFDIECVSSSGGFPKPENDGDFISAITFQNMNTNQYFIFGLKPYNNTVSNTEYILCSSEENLLEQIIDFFNRQDIDVLSGWNISGFDIPYLVKRINKILGEDAANRLSPDKRLFHGHATINKRQTEVYRIQGISTLDYLVLYQKFTYDNKDSYSLDNISSLELSNQKLEYKTEYESLNQLYEQNHQLYIEYNQKDVELVYLLDQKLKFIDIAINYAYMMKCDLESIFGTVTPWDANLYNVLYHKNILCPPKKVQRAEDYEGGYVLDPVRGLHRWVTVYDIVSSYPNQLISSNMGPETIVPEWYINKHDDLKAIRKSFFGVEACLDIDRLEKIKPILEKHNLSYTCNGQFFYKDKQSFIASVVSEVFQKRVEIKKQIKLTKNKQEKELLESKSQITKIAINSCYGFLGCNFSRYYDTRIAEAITLQGQLCARGVNTYLEKQNPMISWVYQDTDSGFFNLEKVVNKKYNNNVPYSQTVVDFILKYQKKVLEPCVDEYVQRLGSAINVNKMTIEIEHECIADKSIFVEKKLYLMRQVYKEGVNLVDKPKFKIKGLAVIKTAAYPAFVREAMKKIIEVMVDTEDNKRCMEMIQEFKKIFYKCSFAQISKPTSINLIGNRTQPDGSVIQIPLTLKTSGLPLQARAALIYNQALVEHKLHNKYQPIASGSKMRYIYIKQPNIFGSKVFGCPEKVPKEFEGKFEIDYDEQWKVLFMKPMTIVMDSIGFNFEKKIDMNSFFDD